MAEKLSNFTKELTNLINIHSLENISGTPDLIISEYLTNCLINYNNMCEKRNKWYE